MKNITLLGMIFLSFILARRDCLQYAELDALGRSNRPEKDTLAISPSGHFYIHFDITGNAAPDLTDSDANGVPDYVDEVGIIADSAHYILVDIMEWEEEPFDGEGGYDIYIMSYAAGIYGFNYKDIGNTSYLQIDNDYVDYNSKFDLDPIEIMRITVGHEYFHGIQWGYEGNLGNNAYFYEMTSMWFEDVLIPDGNDYLDGWVDDLLDNPTSAFDDTGDGYELALFGHYLSSFLDPKGIHTAMNSSIIREIWERFGSTSSNAFNSMKYVLNNGYNISFIETWTDFMSRNLYNGIYTNMDNPFYYYIDQAKLVDPTILDTIVLIDPISTVTTLLSDSTEFELELDNESAAIESFSIGSLESLITIKQSINNFIGRVAIVSTENTEYNNLFWGSDPNLEESFTLEESFNNAEVHFIYGTDGPSIILPIEITAHSVPLPPSNIMAVSAQDSIILSWDPSPGPGENLSYVVFRDNDSIYVINDTIYVDKHNVEGGQSYTYKVTCRNNIGESNTSGTITVTSWPNEESVINSIIMNIYPNPIRQSQELTILYALDSYYLNPIVDLISIKGEVVNSIRLSSFSQGWHRENINLILNNNPSNGVYFISLQPNQESRQTTKITIVN